MNLLLIESIPLLRQSLCRLLEYDLHQQLLFSTCSLKELETLPDYFTVDLFWLDSDISEVRDCSFITSFQKKHPQTKMLLFGSDESMQEIRRYYKHNVSAYLPKKAEIEEIKAALVCVEAGELYIPDTIKHLFTRWLTEPKTPKKTTQKLTPRECEILRLIMEEFTSKEIAKKLYISQCTVDTHRLNLIQKFGVRNTAGLVRVAFEGGWY